MKFNVKHLLKLYEQRKMKTVNVWIVWYAVSDNILPLTYAFNNRPKIQITYWRRITQIYVFEKYIYDFLTKGLMLVNLCLLQGLSSTASYIDRRKSNLRTLQILALTTHLITHKLTISGVSSTNRADMEKQFWANVTWVREV